MLEIQPYRLFKTGIIIFIFSLLLGVVIPGWVANNNDVFYESGIKLKLPKDAKAKLLSFEDAQNKKRAQVMQIDSIVSLQTKSQTEKQGSEILILKDKLNDELKEEKSPIQLQPFYLSPIMYVWASIYCTLGWLIFLIHPCKNNRYLNLKNTLIVTFSIYIIYQWTVWMRNFVVNSEHRIVYSFANYDISDGSFFMQEANTILFSFMLSVVLQKWFFYYSTCVNDGKILLKENNKLDILSSQLQTSLSKTFLDWQVSSVILALGFIDFTSAFWTLIIRQHDQRYLMAGIVIHSLWGLAWIAISLPLIVRWFTFQNLKSEAKSFTVK